MTNKWVWPKLGCNPSSQNNNFKRFSGVDSEDAEYLVREAVQNSLDAVVDPDSDVEVTFNFINNQNNGLMDEYFSGLWEYREHASTTENPLKTGEGREISWLVITDKKTSGLRGEYDSRDSDFWKYWMDWGKSKTGNALRGKFGVGRAAILKASEIRTVIGITRQERSRDHLICGYSLLNACDYDGIRRTNYAYFASEEWEERSIFRLHPEDLIENFHDAFNIPRLEGPGTCLAIPFPFDIYNPENIKAGLIAHFLPALLDGRLKATVQVNGEGEEINQQSIRNFSSEIKNHLKNRQPCFQAFKTNPDSFIDFLDEYSSVDPRYDFDKFYQHGHFFRLDSPRLLEKALAGDAYNDEKESLLNSIKSGNLTALRVDFPIRYNDGSLEETFITAGIKQTEENEEGVSLSYRGGMAIYDMNRSTLRGYHACVFADDPHISKYLNACEGEAHKSWTKDTEVREELERIFDNDTTYGILDLAKKLFVSIEKWMNQRDEEINTSLLEDDFSVDLDLGDSEPESEKNAGDGSEDDLTENDSDEIVIVKRTKLPFRHGRYGEDGIRVKGVASESKSYPIKIKIKLGYADGSSRSIERWNPSDFLIEELTNQADACSIISIGENEVIVESKDENFTFDVFGFDKNRAIDIRVVQI